MLPKKSRQKLNLKRKRERSVKEQKQKGEERGQSGKRGCVQRLKLK